MSRESSFEEDTPSEGWDVKKLEIYIYKMQTKMTYLVENTHTHPWPLDEALDYEQLNYNLQQAQKELQRIQNLLQSVDPTVSLYNPAAIETPNSNQQHISVDNKILEVRRERKEQIQRKRQEIIEKQRSAEKEEESILRKHLEEARIQRLKSDKEKEEGYIQEINRYKQQEEKLRHKIKKLKLKINSLQYNTNAYDAYLEEESDYTTKSKVQAPPPKNYTKQKEISIKTPSMVQNEKAKLLKEQFMKQHNNFSSSPELLNTNTSVPASERKPSSKQLQSDAMMKVNEWEKQKQKFVFEMENIRNQCAVKLEYLLTDYILKYENATQNLSKDKQLLFDFHKFIEMEKERLEALSKILFPTSNLPAITSVTNYISSIQNNLSGMGDSLVLIQSFLRSYLTRKKWFPIFKSMRLRNQCSTEIYETEKTYYQNLTNLIRVFRKRMEDKLTKLDIDNIFSTIPSFIGTSEALLATLEKRMNSWSNNQCIGDVFLEFAPYFKSYIQYVNNYDNSLAILDRMMKLPSVVELLKKSKDESGGLDIHSFLIMPIQRVPRYALLLKELHRLTPPFHRDYNNLSLALTEISKVASLINENKAEEENKRKVRAISELFGNKCEDLVQPQRRYVHEGEVISNSHNFCTMEKETRDPYECHLFLFNDLLLIGKKPNISISGALAKMGVTQLVSDRATYNFKEKIQVDGMIVGEYDGDEVPSSQFGFFVKYKTRLPDYFFVTTVAMRDEWVSILKQTISNFGARKSTLRLTESIDPWEIPTAQSSNNNNNYYSYFESSYSSSNYNNSNNNNINNNNSQWPSQHDNNNRNSIILRENEFSTLRLLLPLYSEAMWLLKELFTVPIELQTFIPEYCQQFPPDYLTTINSRLTLVKRRVNDMNVVRDKIIPLLKNEKIVVEINDTILYGKIPLHSAFVWVQNTFPPDSIDTKPRELLKDLLQWYNHLNRLWNSIMDIPV